MLESVELRNIQKHKNLKLDFVAGINIICGSTDAGKTSIIRGLLWNALNQGTSEKLLNNQGAKDCEVISVYDGHSVSRAYSKTNNSYSLDGNEFKSFRTGVPDPIVKLINIDSINIQRRRDMPFMVYWKASENADQFSAMLDISEINCSISNINRMVKDADSSIKVVSEQIKEVENGLRQHENTSNAQLAFSQCYDNVKKLRAIRERYSKIDEIKQKGKAISAELKQLEGVIQAVECFSGITEQVNQLKDKKSKLANYKQLVQTYNTVGSKVDEFVSASSAKSLFESLYITFEDLVVVKRKVTDLKAVAYKVYTCEDNLAKYVDAPLAQEYYSKTLESLQKAIAELKAKSTSLYTLRSRLQIADSTCTKAEQEYTNSKKAFDEAMPETCPLCGSMKGQNETN